MYALHNDVLSIIPSVKKDLDGKLTHLVSAHVEGSVNVVTLLLTGRATPYLHNGVMYVGDEDHYVSDLSSYLTHSLYSCNRYSQNKFETVINLETLPQFK